MYAAINDESDESKLTAIPGTKDACRSVLCLLSGKVVYLLKWVG